MPNWSSNTIAIRGTKTQVINFLNEGLKHKYGEDENFTPIPLDASNEVIEEKLRNYDLSLRSWLPMPDTFNEWDTTNQMDSFVSWLSGGVHNDKTYSPLLDGQEVYQAVKAAATEKFGGDEYTREQEDDVAKELYQQYVADYVKYCDGYKAAKQYQQETYGVVGWYDYNCQTLGTKWDSDFDSWQIHCDTDDMFIILGNCQTAWSLPDAWGSTIMEKHPDLQVAIYADEEGGFYCGYTNWGCQDWVENDTDFWKKSIEKWKSDNECDVKEDDDTIFDEHYDEIWAIQDDFKAEQYNRFLEYISE